MFWLLVGRIWVGSLCFIPWTTSSSIHLMEWVQGTGSRVSIGFIIFQETEHSLQSYQGKGGACYGITWTISSTFNRDTQVDVDRIFSLIRLTVASLCFFMYYFGTRTWGWGCVFGAENVCFGLQLQFFGTWWKRFYNFCGVGEGGAANTQLLTLFFSLLNSFVRMFCYQMKPIWRIM